MKTYIFALVVVAVVVASMANASCVKQACKAMGTINVALTGGR